MNCTSCGKVMYAGQRCQCGTPRTAEHVREIGLAQLVRQAEAEGRGAPEHRNAGGQPPPTTISSPRASRWAIRRETEAWLL
jgi:hypothetical protein